VHPEIRQNDLPVVSYHDIARVNISNDESSQMDNAYCTCKFNRLRDKKSFRPCATPINLTTYQFQAVSINIVVKEFYHISVGEPGGDRGLDSRLPVFDLSNERRAYTWPKIPSSASQEYLGDCKNVSKPDQPPSCRARVRYRRLCDAYCRHEEPLSQPDAEHCKPTHNPRYGGTDHGRDITKNTAVRIPKDVDPRGLPVSWRIGEIKKVLLKHLSCELRGTA
jgi:hypothetical protein